MTQLKSELAIKRDEWFESEEGKKCCDNTTLPTGKTGGRYLKHRIESAFLAGAIANNEMHEELINKVITAIEDD